MKARPQKVGVRVCLFVFVCVCVCACVHACMCVCGYTDVCTHTALQLTRKIVTLLYHKNGQSLRMSSSITHMPSHQALHKSHLTKSAISCESCMLPARTRSSSPQSTTSSWTLPSSSGRLRGLPLPGSTPMSSPCANTCSAMKWDYRWVGGTNDFIMQLVPSHPLMND